MTVRSMWLDEWEDKQAFEDMLEKRRNGARDMFHYESPVAPLSKGTWRIGDDEGEEVASIGACTTAKGRQVTFTSAWAMGDDGQWFKKAIPIMIKHRLGVNE